LLNVNLLEAMVRQGHRKVFFASNSSVYSESDQPLDESQVSPETDEGLNSLLLERLYFRYAEEFDLDLRVARIFSPYGPPLSREGSPLNEFCMRLANLEEGETFDWPNRKINPIYLKDLIEGIRLLVESDCEEVVNLGSSAVTSFGEIAGLLSKQTHQNFTITWGQTDECIAYPSIELARRKLGWSPTTDLHEGLRSTYQWARSYALVKSNAASEVDDSPLMEEISYDFFR
jgi:UDP-glucuronate decarboxylase